jgi:hypothetical protein
VPRYKMLILSRPRQGREARYNEWYDRVHLPQMLALPGFKAAQRFRHTRTLGEREAFPYAALYDIETRNLDGVLRELYRVAGSRSLLIDESLDRDSVYAAVYEAQGPVRRRKPAATRRRGAHPRA